MESSVWYVENLTIPKLKIELTWPPQSLDPGNLKTDLYKSMPRWQMPIVNMALKDPIYGAYTELFGGLSPVISLSNTGIFSKCILTKEIIVGQSV